jgi:hypothetical protein
MKYVRGSRNRVPADFSWVGAQTAALTALLDRPFCHVTRFDWPPVVEASSTNARFVVLIFIENSGSECSGHRFAEVTTSGVQSPYLTLLCQGVWDNGKRRI